MQLSDLMNNPTGIIDNLRIQGPDGVSTSPGYIDVTCSVTTSASSASYTNNIALIVNAVTRGNAAFAGSVNQQRVTITADDNGSCYWLPWGEGKVYMGAVRQSCAYFFTYTINGCGVIIGGTQTQPIVAHANLKSKRLDDATALGFEGAAKEQALIYEQFYGSLAAELIQTGRMTGDKITVITPQEYLIEAQAGFGAVFGIRKGANWEFYGNWGKKTRKIWPR